ncbi:MAG: hypothetical protein ACERIG_03070 [Hyphomicrobium sp.]
MHRCVATYVMILTLMAAPPLAADETCNAQVKEAFSKQRTSPAFRMVAKLRGETGPVEITAEYVPPSRMRQIIVAPGQSAPLETVLVGTRAWSNQGGRWKELMPGLVHSIIAQVREATVDPPKVVGDFECLDKVTVDGKEYIAYRSIEKPGAPAKASLIEGPVRRTIYVDPNTGLPAINVVKEQNPDVTPIFEGVYTYPTNIIIEGYPNAPLVKMR